MENARIREEEDPRCDKERCLNVDNKEIYSDIDERIELLLHADKGTM